ncbi:amylo-alpha-1,6-glucosidase, partial [Verrucomicrobiota bacterium]
YPVEIQALWHSALSLLSAEDDSRDWSGLADQVRSSIAELFPRRAARDTLFFLSDCLHASRGRAARDAAADDHLRPNQLLALTLGAVTDGKLCRGVLRACEELLVPGAVRSLADRPVEHLLAVEHRGGLLNDPSSPYWGKYSGDEDTRRKPAYHNGTAWTWLFPSYCEAMHLTYGEEARGVATALLLSSLALLEKGCIGQIPELLDGDSPHAQKGCGAQAWGVSEFLRLLAILTGK